MSGKIPISIKLFMNPQICSVIIVKHCWNILPQPLRLAESAKTFSNTLKRRLLHNIEIDERYVVDNSYNYIYKLND